MTVIYMVTKKCILVVHSFKSKLLIALLFVLFAVELQRYTHLTIRYIAIFASQYDTYRKYFQT